MNIPDKAYEAAARDLFVDMMERQNPAMSAWDLASLWGVTAPDHHDYYRRMARRALEAAAPFIAAQALRDAAEALQAEVSHANPTSAKAWIRAEVAADIRDHAHKLDQQ